MNLEWDGRSGRSGSSAGEERGLIMNRLMYSMFNGKYIDVTGTSRTLVSVLKSVSF